MLYKTVEAIIAPSEPHFVGDGFRVHNFIPSFPSLSMKRMSPFILLDYNSKYQFSAREIPRGVGVHPHRGFETVTIAYKGKVEHHDSSGGGGIIEEGDVQWMTAAAGILHKEFHEKEWSKNGGEFQMVQVWINLPAKDKTSSPKYQALSNNRIQRFILNKQQGELEIIAGNYQGIQGAASTFTPIHLYNAKLNQDSEVEFLFPKEYNTALLVIEGDITVNESSNAPFNHFVLLKNDGEKIKIKANEKSIVLILSGEPIDEPIAAHGPFVMNNPEELVQAFEDYNTGKFGVLAE